MDLGDNLSRLKRAPAFQAGALIILLKLNKFLLYLVSKLSYVRIVIVDEKKRS